MKFIAMFLFVAGVALAGTEFSKTDRLKQMIDAYSGDTGIDAEPSSVFLNFAKENGIPQSEVYKIIEGLARTFFAEMQTAANSEARFLREVGLSKLLGFMGYTQNPSWLPFMDEIYAATTNEMVRYCVVSAKIDIQKADCIEFVERAIQSGEIEQRQVDRIWEKMGEQYSRVNDNDKRKISAFLLRQMEKETGISNQKRLEDMLAVNCVEYRTSKQRKKYAERFLNSGHVFAHDLGKAMMKEIERVSPEQRADLSELLRKSADETKTE